MGAVAAVGALVVAHVLYDAQDGHAHIAEHRRAPPGIYERNVLQAVLCFQVPAVASSIGKPSQHLRQLSLRIPAGHVGPVPAMELPVWRDARIRIA